MKLVPVALDVPQPAESALAPIQVRPRAVCYQGESRVERITVNYRPDGGAEADLSMLTGDRTLVFYGGMDTGVFRRLVRQLPDVVEPPFVDLFEVVEGMVHAPLPGLTLEAVAGFAEGRLTGGPFGRAEERVAAIGTVVRWLAGLTGTAA
jgi:hypothetical protein